MIATAGADRLQEGMRNSFGKPSSRAARVKHNQRIISIQTTEGNLELARVALQAGAAKFPSPCRVVIEDSPTIQLKSS
jgi:large subunit ribosomal protein L10e